MKIKIEEIKTGYTTKRIKIYFNNYLFDSLELEEFDEVYHFTKSEIIHNIRKLFNEIKDNNKFYIKDNANNIYKLEHLTHFKNIVENYKFYKRLKTQLERKNTNSIEVFNGTTKTTYFKTFEICKI